MNGRRFAGLRVFNVNDAGVNARIASSVAPVDILAVQFSASASGYPWTWAHLFDEEKTAISSRACAGKLELVKEAARVYAASTVLPFASHFSLWHPSHREYARLMKRNTLDQVKSCLAGSEVEVIDLLPGDRGNVGDGTISRLDQDRADLFAPDRIAAYVETAVDPTTFEASHPSDDTLTESPLIEYFDRINWVPEIVHCEELSVSLRAPSSTGGNELTVSFAIAAGRLSILDEPPPVPNLTITIPLAVLTAVVRESFSWDEAFIGYWCRFDRHPNVYHAGFWRLLQAPYFKKPVPISAASPFAIGRGSTIAGVLEAHGANADRVLRRYGLCCSGCDHSTVELIEAAARQHGVDARGIDMLVRELARVCEAG